MQTLRRGAGAWWIILLVLPALAPLARTGFFASHDGAFHVYRLMALEDAVRGGVLYPRWFPDFAFGYGHPVLNFYGPLSYYWGLVFALLGAGPVLATKLLFATGLAASALGMYAFARLHFDRFPAVVAGVLYAYLPYHLIDLYVRGAVAEFLAFVWFPLLLLAFHRLAEEEEGWRAVVWTILSALLGVALVTTHSLSALIFVPCLAGYLAILWWRRRQWRVVARFLAVGGLGLALGAFYWLPVMLESRYVGLGHGVSQGYRDHLLSVMDLIFPGPIYDYAAEAPITFPIGWLHVGLLLAAVPLPLLVRRRRLPTLFFLAVGLFSVFMLTDISLPVWRTFESALAFLQYPWRFQALTVLATAFLGGMFLQVAVERLPRAGVAMGGLVLLLVGLFALPGLPVTSSYPDLSVEGMWRLDRDLSQVGATWTGEYVPVWVKEQRWAISFPRPAGTPAEPLPSISYGVHQARLKGVGDTRYHLELDAPQGTSLSLHQFYYPGWQAHWQGQVIPARPEGELGLAAFDLPPGSGSLVLRLALTPAQRWGTIVSLLACLAAAAALLIRFQLLRSGPSDAPSWRDEGLLVGGLALVCSLLAVVLLGSLLLPNGYVRETRPIGANLEDQVELQAFTIEDTHYHPGDTVRLTLYWMALTELGEDYKTFIHLTDVEVTQQPTQHDGDPGGDFTPTTRWLPGELVPDTHTLSLPLDLPPGRYHLWADMYQYPSVQNLTVVSAEVPTDGKRVLLGEIQVEP
ncbi:MAG: 6-pyruvoyl-tetrahydropterin synthase-related protein [Anaerolineae bacterium]